MYSWSSETPLYCPPKFACHSLLIRSHPLLLVLSGVHILYCDFASLRCPFRRPHEIIPGLVVDRQIGSLTRTWCAFELQRLGRSSEPWAQGHVKMKDRNCWLSTLFYIYDYIYIWLIYIYIHIHIYIYMYLYVCIYVYIHIYTHIHIYIWNYLHIIYTYVYLYICICYFQPFRKNGTLVIIQFDFSWFSGPLRPPSSKEFLWSDQTSNFDEFCSRASNFDLDLDGSSMLITFTWKKSWLLHLLDTLQAPLVFPASTLP
jgi:hypothetical protein